MVVKPLFGSEGRGMVRVSDPEMAWRTFRTLERTQAVLYLQQFIRHPGWDLRVFVLGGRVLTAMRRRSRGDWRTNVAQGGDRRADPPGAGGGAAGPARRPRSARRWPAWICCRGRTASGTSWRSTPCPAGGRWRRSTGVDVAAAVVRFLADGVSHGGDAVFASHSACTRRLACIWEATARKPGNVHRFRDFDDANYLDFLLSAAAVGSGAGRVAVSSRVGRTVLEAVRRTRRVVRTNTNLGILLLLAPLASGRRRGPARRIAGACSTA